jgi:hypothetical protein
MLPSKLYGPERAVTEAALRLARLVEHGAPLEDAVPADLEPSGLVVLQGGSPLIRDDDAHRVYAVHVHLGARSPESATLFEQTLEVPWGVLALLGQDTQPWLLNPASHRPFLRAVREHHRAIIALDGRYTLGQPVGAALWDLPTNLRYVLAHQGVAVQELLSRRTAEGWLGLVCAALDE